MASVNLPRYIQIDETSLKGLRETKLYTSIVSLSMEVVTCLKICLSGYTALQAFEGGLFSSKIT